MPHKVFSNTMKLYFWCSYRSQLLDGVTVLDHAGFCVINNDRARILHADCERVILLFAEQPYSEGLKLPTAKRQRADAVTLDLDVARVKEAEAFDWTQTPLGSELLQLGSQELPDPQEVSGWAMEIIPSMPSLLEVTEAFPAQPPEQPEQLDQVEADQADAADVRGVALGVPELAELGAELDLRDPEMGVEAAKKRRRRHPPVPGYVHGWDEETTAELPAAVVGASTSLSLPLSDVSSEGRHCT